MFDSTELVDSHIHLDRVQAVDKSYNQIKSLIPGVDGEEHLDLKSKFPKCRLATGFHPMMASENCDLKNLESLLETGRFSAVGECGFDRRWKNLEQQKDLFANQIDLAIKFNLPMIIHSVGHVNELMEMATLSQFKGVIHYYAFKSLPDVFLENGLYFGFCSKLSNQSQAFKIFEKIPLEKILIETDADDTGSADFDALRKTYNALATIKKIDLQKLIPIISSNFERMLEG